MRCGWYLLSISGLLWRSTTCDPKFSRHIAAVSVDLTAVRYGRRVFDWFRRTLPSQIQRLPNFLHLNRHLIFGNDQQTRSRQVRHAGNLDRQNHSRIVLETCAKDVREFPSTGIAEVLQRHNNPPYYTRLHDAGRGPERHWEGRIVNLRGCIQGRNSSRARTCWRGYSQYGKQRPRYKRKSVFHHVGSNPLARWQAHHLWTSL